MPVENPQLEQALLKVLEGFGEHYEIRHQVDVGGAVAHAVAELHLEEAKTLFGFSMKGMNMGFTTSNDFVFFVLADELTPEVVQQMIALTENAERELLQVDDHHAYTFFSCAALTTAIRPEAAAILRKHSSRPKYKHGWGMTRLSAVDIGGRVCASNKDGKELGKVVLGHLRA